MAGIASALLVLCASPSSRADTPAPSTEEERKTAAQEHFNRGNELLADEAWDAALAEFLESRRLRSTKAATKNAALALHRLKRYAEALEMFESLMNEFTGLSDRDKQLVEREMAALRAVVGTLLVRPTEPGGTLSVDGQTSGELSSPVQVRLSSGSHQVRVARKGFALFETRVTVVGGKTSVVEVKLQPLAESGTLQVVESGGRPATVVFDGIEIGPTPWNGSVSPGSHTVRLRGAGRLGTQPLSAPVRVNETTVLRVALEELRGRLAVVPVPAHATVAIDGVNVGRGQWEGNVREGVHQIEVGAEGFIPSKQAVTVASAQQAPVHVALERDPTSPIWGARSRGHLVVLGGARFLIGPGTGDLAGACGGSCAARPLLGATASLAVGYSTPIGVTLGLEGGYGMLTWSVQDREDAVRILPAGSGLQNPGTTNDSLTFRGPRIGALARYERGESLRWSANLHVGAWLGETIDRRTGTYTTQLNQTPTGVGVPTAYNLALRQSVPASYLYAEPELGVAKSLSERFQVRASLGLSFLLATSSPRWEVEKGRVVTGTCGPTPTANCVTDGLGEFGSDTMLGSFVPLLSAGISGEYQF